MKRDVVENRFWEMAKEERAEEIASRQYRESHPEFFEMAREATRYFRRKHMTMLFLLRKQRFSMQKRKAEQ